jgi:hypothetical protein
MFIKTIFAISFAALALAAATPAVQPRHLSQESTFCLVRPFGTKLNQTNVDPGSVANAITEVATNVDADVLSHDTY